MCLRWRKLSRRRWLVEWLVENNNGCYCGYSQRQAPSMIITNKKSRFFLFSRTSCTNSIIDYPSVLGTQPEPIPYLDTTDAANDIFPHGQAKYLSTSVETVTATTTAVENGDVMRDGSMYHHSDTYRGILNPHDHKAYGRSVTSSSSPSSSLRITSLNSWLQNKFFYPKSNYVGRNPKPIELHPFLLMSSGASQCRRYLHHLSTLPSSSLSSSSSDDHHPRNSATPVIETVVEDQPYSDQLQQLLMTTTKSPVDHGPSHDKIAIAVRAKELWHAILRQREENPHHYDDQLPSSTSTVVGINGQNTKPHNEVPIDNSIGAIVEIWSHTKHPTWIIEAQQVLIGKEASELEPHQWLNLALSPILQAWAYCNDGLMAQKWVEDTLMQRQELDSETITSAYNMVLAAWTGIHSSNSHGQVRSEDWNQAMALFNRMQQQQITNDETYSILISVLLNNDGATTIAQNFFDKFIQYSKEMPQENPITNIHHRYGDIMELGAWLGDGERTEALLRQLQDHDIKAGGGQIQGHTNRNHYHSAIVAWSKSTTRSTRANSYDLGRALKLFQEMKTATSQDSSDAEPLLKPNNQTYALLIKAFCRHALSNQKKKDWLLSQAQQLWEEMLDQYLNKGDVSCRPTNSDSQNELVWGWASLGRGDQIETIIQQLWQAGITPTGIEYQAAIEAWTKVSDDEGMFRVLLDMLRRSGEGHEHLKPNRTMLSNAIISLTSGKPGQQQQQQHHEVEKAQVLLEEMFLQSEKSVDDTLRPSLDECQNVVSAWGRIGNGRAANDLLRQMVNEWKIQSDQFCYETIIAAVLGVQNRKEFLTELLRNRREMHASIYKRIRNVKQPSITGQPLAESQDVTSGPPAKLSLESYNLAMQQLARKQSPNAGRDAQALFDHMLQRAEKGEVELKPNVASYHALISAWTCNLNISGVSKAYELFQDMLWKTRLGESQLQPDLAIYETLLRASSKLGNVECCETVMKQMVSDCSWDEDCPSPETRLFNMVIAAWSRSKQTDAGERGEQVLRWMQSLNQNNTLKINCQPDGTSFVNAIQAWAVQCQSHSEQALQKAEGLFQEMQGLWGNGKDDRFRPTVIAYLAMAQMIAKCHHLDDHEKRQRFRTLVEQIKSHRLPKDERLMAVIRQWTDDVRR